LSEAPTDRSSPLAGRADALFVLATLFCSGTAVMVVEMTAVRALQPFFGSTTYVWTNVIAVCLAALTVGYALGGRLADRMPRPVLLYGLLAVGGVLLVAGTALITPLSQMFLEAGVNLEGVPTVLIKGSLGVSLAVFAPAILLLGMVTPLAIRLLDTMGTGKAAGTVFAVSTTGSIAGTYLPTLYLVPQFGSRGTLYLAAALLLVPAVAGAARFGMRKGRSTAAALLALLLSGGIAAAAGTSPDRGPPSMLDGGTARVLTEVESPYQYLTVRDDTLGDGTQFRLLTINEGLHTYHSLRVKDRVLTQSRYYDDYSVLPMLLDKAPGDELRMCVLGLACGINASQWKHFWGDLYDLKVDGAELDPDIVRLGREHFDLPAKDSDWLRAVAMDGRQMLASLPADTKYDVIVVDAFANELYIPFHLATREFFEICRDHLAPGGILAMNCYAEGQDAPNLLAIENTLALTFGNAVRVTQYWGSNFLLMAREGDERPDLGPVGRRFGDREDLAEWQRLRTLAGAMPGNARHVSGDTSSRILTDDDAPLEWLTDRFLDRTEERIRGR
jgi:spermidine synthase